MPPSSLRITTVAARGRATPGPSGHVLIAPVALGLESPLAGSPGVLDVDEQSALIWRDGDAGDLAPARSGEEAPDVPGRGIGGQHHVGGDVHVVAGAQRARGDVGLDPEDTPAVRPQAVRRAEQCRPGCCRASQRWRSRGSPACTKMLHRNVTAVGFAPVFRPAHDVAERVVDARVRGVDARAGPRPRARCCWCRVEVDVAVRHHRDPLRPVHPRRPHPVRRLPRANEDVRLAREAARGDRARSGRRRAGSTGPRPPALNCAT